MIGFSVKADTLRDTGRISKKLLARCILRRHGAAKHAVLNILLQAGRSEDMVQLVDNFVQRFSLPARGMLVGIYPGWSCRERCMDGSVEVGCFGEFLGCGDLKSVTLSGWYIHVVKTQTMPDAFFFVWSVL